MVLISQGYIDQLAKIESSDKPLAENPNSSAKGRFQFIDATAKQYGLDQYQFGTPEYEVAEINAVKAFTQDNYNALEKELGRPPTNGELYLAHQQGVGGAKKILTSSPESLAVDVLGRDEVLNNGGNENTTVGEFKQKWTEKFSDLDAQQKKVETIDLYKLASKNKKNKSLDLYDIANQEKLKPKAPPLPLDTKTGAPPYIRALVGSVRKPEDRLKTLQKYYKDAEPFGDNNFTFTNPETGLKTVYNPKGLDGGDFPSLAREALITAGSVVGGTLAGGGAIVAGQAGPQIVTPEELVTVPLAIGAGSGLGGALGASAFDTIALALGLKVDTRTPKEMALEAAGEVSLGIAGEFGGRVVGALAQPLKKPLVQGAELTKTKILEAFDAMGVKPTLATVSPEKAIPSRLQAGLSQNIISAEQIENIAKEQIDQTNKAINKVIADIGPARTTAGAGETIQKAAIKASQRFKSLQQEVYEDAFDRIGRETPTEVKNIIDLRKDIANKISKAPETLTPLYGKMLNELDAIIRDSGSVEQVIKTGLLDEFGNPISRAVSRKGEGIEFETLRQIRTAVGKRMKEPNLVDSGALVQTQLDMIYSALTLDISEAAAKAGPEAAQKLKVADRATRMFMNTSAKTLEKIHRFDGEERAFKYVLNNVKDGASRLRRLKNNFTPEEWDVVAASTLRRLGNPMEDGTFTLSTFLTNYKQLAPETKKTLLGGNRYGEVRKSLDNLVIVLEQLKDVEKYSNASNTAGATHVIYLISSVGGTLGGGVGALLGDPAFSTAGTVLGFTATTAVQQGAPLAAAKVVSSEKIARLVANPAFIRWLSEPMTALKWGAAESAEHVARLAIIADKNPDIADAIYDYSVILENNTRSEE